MDVRLGSHMAALAAHEALHSKSERLSQDNAAIDAGIAEAREKADAAMSAAEAGLAIGVTQGLISIGSAAAGAVQPEPTSKVGSRLPDMVSIDGLHSFMTARDSLDELEEEQQLRLQTAEDRASTVMTTLSNAVTKVSQIQDAVTQNLK